MQVTVSFSGPIRRPWPEASRSVELAPTTTVRGLLSTLGFAATEHATLHTAVNGAMARPWTVLEHGDLVVVMLKAGGG